MAIQDGLKEDRRAISVGPVKGVAENQKSESTGSDTRHRWATLAQGPTPRICAAG
jgi:hypothetical protein